MRMFTVNMNDAVKVRLTDLGKDIYYHRYDNLNQRAGREICEPKFPVVDEEGYTSFQLWDFISLYGGYIGMARRNVIEPLDIICPIQGHDDPPGKPGLRGVASKYLARDVVERTIADVINRGGTMGEIMTEVHHLDGADEDGVVLDNIKEAHINLCDSCEHLFPECPAGRDDALFGNYDNVCACAKYRCAADMMEEE